MRVFAVHRRFWLIFAASLAAHAIALAWVTLRPKAARAIDPPTILASLRLIAAAQSGLTAVAPPAPAVVPQQARQLPPRREQRSARRAVEAAAPPVLAMPEATTAATAAPAAAASPAQPSAAVAHASPPVAETAPARPQGSLLDAYRQRLAELLAGQQQYPRVAAQRGWEGEVRLRLQVARKGNLVSVHIDSSSGFEVLDQHALAMLDRLASLPPLPDGLEASEIQVVVPVNYRLRKAT